MGWTKARVSPSISRARSTYSHGLWTVSGPFGEITTQSHIDALSLHQACEAVIAQTSLCVGTSGGSSVSIYEQSWVSLSDIAAVVLAKRPSRYGSSPQREGEEK